MTAAFTKGRRENHRGLQLVRSGYSTACLGKEAELGKNSLEQERKHVRRL